MATPPTAAVRQVGLLVLEADSGNSGALKQILDSEGWRVRIVGDLQLLHMELKTGEYSLVIANIEMVGLDTPTFHVLKELAAVAPEEGGRIRVLYVVSELAGSQFVPALEKAKSAVRGEAVPPARFSGKSERFAGGSEGHRRTAAHDAV